MGEMKIINQKQIDRYMHKYFKFFKFLQNIYVKIFYT